MTQNGRTLRRAVAVLAGVALGLVSILLVAKGRGAAQSSQSTTAPALDYGTSRGPGFDYGKQLPPIPWKGPRRTEPVAHNFRVVGWTDANGHPDAEQITGQVIDGRDYIFMGHYWSQGVSIIDVTDPSKPEVVGYIPVRDAHTKSTKVQVSGTTLMVPVRPLYELDQRPPPPAKYGVNFYDVSNPRAPRHLSFFATGDGDAEGTGGGVHWSWFGSRYAYLSAAVNGYRGLIFMIVDVSDPKNPREVSRYHAPGQHVAGGEKFQPGVTPVGHGAQPNRDETLGFFSTLSDPPGGVIFLDITDKTKPKCLSRLDMSPPMVDTYFGVHNVVTMDSRRILVALNEATGNPRSKAQMTGWVVDYQDPKRPVILSILPIPQGFDFDVPARFGPHNAHENHPNGLIDDYMLYVSWFRAGVRVFDLSDPKHPVETGYFLPPDPKYRMDARTWSGKPGDPDGSELSSLNHVYVDKRGYVYASGYNDGLYILEYTGPRPAESRATLEKARQERKAMGGPGAQYFAQ